MDKLSVIDQAIKTLKIEIDLAVQASREAYEAATDEDAYSDGQYDTRSLEAWYLAGGQAQIAKELVDALQGFKLLRSQHFLQPPSTQIGMGSLVETQSDKSLTWYLVGPGGGGLEVEADDKTVVTILTLHSPLGLAMASKKEGDTVSLANRSILIKTVL